MGCSSSMPTVPEESLGRQLAEKPSSSASPQSGAPARLETDIFQTTFETSPLGLVITEMSEQGNIHQINGHACKMFGYERSELLGASIDMLVPISVRHVHSSMRAGFAACPAARAIQPLTEGFLKGCRKDGTEIPVEIGLTPVTIHGTRYVLCTIVDQSQRVLAEAMAKTAAEAKAASKARGDTLSTMSHEIRNPLNGVIGAAALLLDIVTTKEQKALVSTIAACGEATLAVVNDILDWQKIDAGRMRLECIDFGPGTVIKEVLDIMSAPAEDRGVKLWARDFSGFSDSSDSSSPNTLRLQLLEDPNIGDSPGTSGMSVLPGVMIRGDPTRVRQILLNLVSNAVKFVADDGSGKVFIHVQLNPVADATGAALKVETRFTLAPVPEGNTVLTASDVSPPHTAHGSKSPRQSGSKGSKEQTVESERRLSAQLQKHTSAPEVSPLNTAALPSPTGMLSQKNGDALHASGVSSHYNLDGPPTHELCICVMDNGVGISQKTAASLFKPFTQAGADTARKHGGTGLGLSICKALASMLGGSISLDSEVGKGSTFTLRLPTRMSLPHASSSDNLHGMTTPVPGGSHLNLNASGTPGTLRAAVATPTSQGPLSSVRALSAHAHPILVGAHILVVDDNAVNRRLTSQMLNKLGCTFSTANDGVDAVVQWCKAMGISTPPHIADAAGLGRMNTTGVETGAGSPSKLGGPRNPSGGNLASLGAPPGVGRVVSHAQGLMAGGNPYMGHGPFTAVLMDCQMPKMDGFEATAAIRALEEELGGAKVPILALTGAAMPEDRERCLTAGMNGHVLKPVRVKDLSSALTQALTVAQTQAALQSGSATFAIG